MRKIAFFLVILSAVGLPLIAQNTTPNATEIVSRAVNKINADTMSTRSRMVITARDGSSSERVIDQYSKDDASGNARSVLVFQNPATVRGTRFLTIGNSSGNSDQWIFLPGIGKVRRIASSESGGSFMGSDFSYDDMSMMGRSVDLDTHTILREETLEGNACYVIQSVPKTSDFQYSKTVIWIDKTNYRVYKREMYDKRGALAKILETSGYKNVQGFDTPSQTKLTTVSAGTFTIIYIDIVKYNDPIPEGVFTTAYLETGRVR